MELVIRELESAVIFSETDIANIKQFLKRKEQQDSNYEMALMMAQMVNKRVNQSLEGIDRKYWWHFKSAFMKFLAADEKKNINKADIFKVLLSLESEVEKAVEVAYKWLMIQTRELVNSRQLEQWLKAIKNGDSVAVSAWKRMMMAATTLAVAGSVNFTELPQSRVQYTPRGETQQIAANHLQVQTAIVGERAAIEAQLQNKYKLQALETVKFQKSTRVADLAGLSQLNKPLVEPVKVITLAAPLRVANGKTINSETKVHQTEVRAESKKMGKRVAVYPSRRVKKSTGEKFMIPEVMALKPYDVGKLRAELVEKNSLLAEEPYFTEIITTAEAFGVDPRFVFAITAQEQGYVKRTNKNAEKIANNPYNVFGSWVHYNTNIGDSSAIVCRTILKRMDKWSGIGDPVVWLNKTYAADLKWNKGVKSHYEKLKNASSIQ